MLQLHARTSSCACEREGKNGPGKMRRQRRLTTRHHGLDFYTCTRSNGLAIQPTNQPQKREINTHANIPTKEESTCFREIGSGMGRRPDGLPAIFFYFPFLGSFTAMTAGMAWSGLVWSGMAFPRDSGDHAATYMCTYICQAQKNPHKSGAGFF